MTCFLLSFIGTSVDTLSLIGSCEVDVVLLANNTALLRLLSHPISHQLNLLAVFNIEPNMEGFQDNLIPQNSHIGLIQYMQNRNLHEI